MSKAKKIIESIDAKTTMAYDDNTDQSVYYRYEDVIKMVNKALNEPITENLIIH